MAKPLVFQLGDREYSFQLNKVDRSKLYGFKTVRALNDADHDCELATLAGDGRTLVGKGGTALGWLDAEGGWREKKELKPVNKEGAEITPVESSFAAPVKLFDTATPEEYLECNVRLVYAIETEDDIDDIMSELKRGTIFSFPYSYRGGLEADAAFLLINSDDEVMMVVGTKTKAEFVGIQAQSAVVEEETTDDSTEDIMDFGMI